MYRDRKSINTCEWGGGGGGGGRGGRGGGHVVPEELAHSVRLLSAQARCQRGLTTIGIPEIQ